MKTTEEKAKEYLEKNWAMSRPVTGLEKHHIPQLMVGFAQSLEETKQDSEEVEYEMLITDDNSPFDKGSWVKIPASRIQDLSKIDYYIKKGVLRTVPLNKKSVSDEEMEIKPKEYESNDKCGSCGNFKLKGDEQNTLCIDCWQKYVNV